MEEMNNPEMENNAEVSQWTIRELLDEVVDLTKDEEVTADPENLSVKKRRKNLETDDLQVSLISLEGARDRPYTLAMINFDGSSLSSEGINSEAGAFTKYTIGVDEDLNLTLSKFSPKPKPELTAGPNASKEGSAHVAVNSIMEDIEEFKKMKEMGLDKVSEDEARLVIETLKHIS